MADGRGWGPPFERRGDRCGCRGGDEPDGPGRHRSAFPFLVRPHNGVLLACGGDRMAVLRVPGHGLGRWTRRLCAGGARRRVRRDPVVARHRHRTAALDGALRHDRASDAGFRIPEHRYWKGPAGDELNCALSHGICFHVHCEHRWMVHRFAGMPAATGWSSPGGPRQDRGGRDVVPEAGLFRWGAHYQCHLDAGNTGERSSCLRRLPGSTSRVCLAGGRWRDFCGHRRVASAARDSVS